MKEYSGQITVNNSGVYKYRARVFVDGRLEASESCDFQTYGKWWIRSTIRKLKLQDNRSALGVIWAYNPDEKVDSDKLTDKEV